MINRILIFILFAFHTATTYGQLAINNFGKGYETGFKKGYCYGQDITCSTPILLVLPMPRLSENLNSYTDGYNRGFQVGLDLQRVSGASSSTYYRSIPTYRSSDYVIPVDLKLIRNVLAYKQKLFDSRADWTQKKILDLDDLCFSLLSKTKPLAYKRISSSISSFVNTQITGHPIDFTDEYLFSQIQSAFKNFEKDIVIEFNKPINSDNLIIPLYDVMNPGTNNGKVVIKLKAANQYTCVSIDSSGRVLENDLVVYTIKLNYNTIVCAYSKRFNSIYTYTLSEVSNNAVPKSEDMDLLGKYSTSLFYGKGIKPIIYERGIKQDNLIYISEEMYTTSNGSSYPFKVYENSLTKQRFFILSLGFDETLPDYQIQIIFSKL